ncbi:unnamed protein product, partial [Brenthis ino]
MSKELQINYPDPGFWTETSMIQLGYGVWVNLSMVSIGLAYGFSAVTLPQLNLPDSSIKVTISDESWIGRMITGFGIGMVMSVPRVYMTEVSLPNMRGVIGSFPNIAMSLGITIQAGLGSVLKWTILCYISCAFAVLLFLLNMKLPETPYYLIQKSLTEDAQKSLKKFRSNKYNTDAEIDEIIDFKNDNNIRRLNFLEQLAALLKRSSYKPFLLMTIFKLIAELSGASIIFMWTVDILERSKSSINPEIGNVLLGVTRIIVGLITAGLIFNVSRRSLAITSGCIFLYFFLPETKDLTLQEIEEYYNDRRSTLTSQRRLMSMQFNTLSATAVTSKSLDNITNRHKKPSIVTFSEN